MPEAEDLVFSVDETGDFSNADDTVLVGGLVASRAAGARFDREVRAQLEARVPGIPWPLHASYLNQLPYIFLAEIHARWSRIDGATGVPLAGITQIAMNTLYADAEGARIITQLLAGSIEEVRPSPRLLEKAAPDMMVLVALRRCPGSLRAAFDALERRREPAWDTLRLISGGIDDGSTLAHWLKSRHRRVMDALWGVLPGALAGETTPVAFVAAGDGPTDHAEDDTARYRRLFDHALERLQRVLVYQQRASRVGVVAATRRGNSGQPSARIPADLGRPREPEPGRTSVFIAPEALVRFDQQAPALLVLADLLLNRVRWTLRFPSGKLGDALKGVQNKSGAALVSGQPPLPHIASGGPTAAILRRLLDQTIADDEACAQLAAAPDSWWAKAEVLEYLDGWRALRSPA